MTAAVAVRDLVGCVTQRFPAAGVAVYRWDAGAALLMPEAGNSHAEADGPASRPLGVGASGRAAERTTPVLVANYAAAVGGATPAGRAGVHSAMSVPVLRDGCLLGAVSVGSDDPQRAFGLADLLDLHVLCGAVLRGAPSAALAGACWGAGRASLATLDALQRAHHRAAIGLACALLGDRRLAEEAVQEVFLALWRTGAAHGPTRGWVLASVRRRALDVLRDRAQARRLTPRDLQPDLEPAGEVDAWERAGGRANGAAVALALGALPDDQRAALELAYFGGLTRTEIAARLGLPAGTVSGHLRLALDRLRVALAPAAPT